MKKRVTSLGGVFFKSHDPEAIKKWYQQNLVELLEVLEVLKGEGVEVVNEYTQ